MGALSSLCTSTRMRAVLDRHRMVAGHRQTQTQTQTQVHSATKASAYGGYGGNTGGNTGVAADGDADSIAGVGVASLAPPPPPPPLGLAPHSPSPPPAPSSSSSQTPLSLSQSLSSRFGQSLHQSQNQNQSQSQGLHATQNTKRDRCPSTLSDTVRSLSQLGRFLELKSLLLHDTQAPLCVNSCDDKGRSALILAAGKGHAEVVSLLMQYGADPTARAGNGAVGATAAHVAAEKGFLKVLKALLAGAGAGAGAAGSSAGSSGSVSAPTRDPASCASNTIALSQLLDAQDHKGETSLHRACREGRMECIRFLVSSGADAEVESARGSTAEDVAGRRGSVYRLCLANALAARGW